jgi:hypothetical protein
MQKRIAQVLPTVLLALVAPLTSSAIEPQPTTTSQSIEQLLGDTSYDHILAPQDFKAEGTNLVKGQSIASGLPLSMAGKLKDFSPATATIAIGKKLDLNAPLAEIKALRELSLNSVVAANPEIANWKASAVNWVEQGEKTLGELAKLDLGKLPLPDVVLNSNSIGSFGNIANTPYSQYLGAEKLTIDKFSDLAKVPISKLISSVSSGPNIRLMRVNKILVDEKNGPGFASKIVSGSDQRPKAQWDKSNPVSGVELVDTVFKDKSNLANGAVAVIGSSQMIPGGNVPSPNQPTALPVPGTPLAISFESPNAKKGNVAIQLNMRLEFPFGARTAYFIPIPTGVSVSEASKSTLVPMEVSLPDSVASKQTTATQNPSTPPFSNTATQSKADNPQKAQMPSQLEVETAKANDVGSAVKGSTNPVTGGVI